MRVAADPDVAQDRYVELSGRAWHVWLRRALIALFVAVLVAALLDAFGQDRTTTSATTREATMRIDAPPRLRGGLLYQVRFQLTARGHALSHPKLVLSENWFDGMSLNNIVPNPSASNTRGGRFAMAFPALGQGKTLTVLTYWQTNPTTHGRRSLVAGFVDGSTPLVVQHRTMTIFP
ncbi:MAG TPA: hypothetical protein VHR88_07040 [Solirubrobacteraceae bacterium]|nr:hypothetical protein [Solirubrobacteraceae bacterium]